MAFIDWDPNFGVGSPALDRQHKVLISLINELHTSLLRAAQKQELGKIFGGLIRYTESHFKSEEGMLRQAGFPGRSAHAVKHVEFLRQVQELHHQSVAGKYRVSIDLLMFLKKWLSEHSLGSDKEYASFLNHD